MIAGLPYDAEVEYLESTGTQWIVPDFSFKDADGEVLEIWCTAMSTFDGSPNTIIRGLVCNNLSTDVTSTGSAVSLQFYWAQTWRNGCNGCGNIQGSSSTATNRTCYVKLDRTNNEIYREMGTYSGTATDSRFAGPFTGIPYVLFANSANGDLPYPARIWSVKFAVDGVVKRDLIPVRFTNGLGQAEGAMYDRVSKKLFRNQGTGAPFVLGPDKAATSVPVMGLHFMRSPVYHAKDYVQAGLVAMWDGIENVGWGVHDASATVWTNLVTGVASANIGVRTWGDSWLETTGSLDLNLADSETNSRTMEVVFQTTSSDVQNVVMSMYTRRVIGTSGTSIGIAPYGAIPVDTVSGHVWSVAVVYPNESNTPDAAYINGLANTDRTSGNFTNPVSSSIRIGGLYSKPFSGKVYCIRLYSIQLAADEIAHNYAVDKERFNLP